MVKPTDGYGKTLVSLEDHEDSVLLKRYERLKEEGKRSGRAGGRSRNDSGSGPIVLRHPGTGYLFDYQRELVGEILDIVSDSSSVHEGLVTLPTGGGKTRTAMWAVFEAVSADTVDVVFWLAPSRELLSQASDAAQAVWEVNPTVEKLSLSESFRSGKVYDQIRPVIVFMTPQMLDSRSGGAGLPDADLVVFDEAHHAVAPSFWAGVEKVRSQESDNVPLIGLSATPGRSREQEIGELVRRFSGNLVKPEILGSEPVERLQDRGVLSRLSFEQIEVDTVVPGLVVRGKDRERPSIKELAQHRGRFKAVVETLKRLASEKQQALVFTADVDHANALCAVLQSSGVAAAVVSSYLDAETRDRRLAKFRAGEIKVLLNRMLLATGYDCPTIRNAVLTVPIESPILFEQIVGRVSRGPLVGGNESGIVWQIDDHINMHGYPSSYSRYSVYDWR